MLKTAIIADDDPISRAKVEEWAIQQNYKIIASVSNGAEAVERILQHRPGQDLLGRDNAEVGRSRVLEELVHLEDYKPDITMVTSYRRRRLSSTPSSWGPRIISLRLHQACRRGTTSSLTNEKWAPKHRCPLPSVLQSAWRCPEAPGQCGRGQNRGCRCRCCRLLPSQSEILLHQGRRQSSWLSWDPSSTYGVPSVSCWPGRNARRLPTLGGDV